MLKEQKYPPQDRMLYNITFAVDNMEELMEEFKTEGIGTIFTFNLEWNRSTEDVKAGALLILFMLEKVSE